MEDSQAVQVKGILVGVDTLPTNVTCPISNAKRLVTLREACGIFASLRPTYWLKAFSITVGAGLLIGLPTRLIPSPLFVRMIPTTWIDYALFVISLVLLGLSWALPRTASSRVTERRSVVGGIGTLLAVGCPTCNKIVLLLLGSGGALSYFAPLQPVLGIAAIVLIGSALWRQLSQLV